MEAFVQWELGLLHQIQDGATAFGDVFWTVITYFGESGIFWMLLSITLMMFQKTRRCGMTMGIALLLGLILGNGVMKNLFARPRPYHLDPTLSFRLLWSEMSTDFSFPSGHTLASFEAAMSIFLYYKNGAWLSSPLRPSSAFPASSFWCTTPRTFWQELSSVSSLLTGHPTFPQTFIL